MTKHIARIGTALCLAIITCGCSGASSNGAQATTPASEPAPASTPEGSVQSVPTAGGPCGATYSRDHDATGIVLEIEGVGQMMVLGVGADWQIDCRPEANQLLRAAQPETARVMTVSIAAPPNTPIDLEADGRATIERLEAGFSQMGTTNVRIAPPRVISDDTYVIALQGELEGQAFSMLNVHRLVDSPVGPLRFHISETSADGRLLNDHASLLIGAAAVFQPVPRQL